jgi:RNA polymerase sigma factor (sigma-70 family)
MAADGTPIHVSTGFGQIIDASIVERAKRGDAHANATIYAMYGSACFNLALRILGERAEAEDVVQDVFLRMMNTVRQFRGEAPFGAWLKRMTVNATIDVLRKNKRFSAGDPLAVFESTADFAPDHDVALDAWNLLMQLPVKARAILVLHQVEGYTHKELADWFGQSESYSKSILARALKRLGALAQVDESRREVQ